MWKAQEQVRDFHRAIKQPHSPAEPKLRNQVLRARLILEEAIETVVGLLGARIAAEAVLEAMHKMADRMGNGEEKYARPSLVETIDGLADTIVVCLGTAEDIGIDLEPFFDEVHRSNMAKVGGPIDATGKQLKPPGWVGPDIAGLLGEVEAAYCAKSGDYLTGEQIAAYRKSVTVDVGDFSFSRNSESVSLFSHRNIDEYVTLPINEKDMEAFIAAYRRSVAMITEDAEVAK